jgi:hypothetical protein
MLKTSSLSTLLLVAAAFTMPFNGAPARDIVLGASITDINQNSSQKGKLMHAEMVAASASVQIMRSERLCFANMRSARL